jgi:hypothetical protein
MFSPTMNPANFAEMDQGRIKRRRGLHLARRLVVAHMWFTSYFVHRKQVIEKSYNGKKCISAPKEIKQGVPQGSVLGTILFYYI